ncbi:hypothetical protein [Brachybacterium sp. NPDC056505]|uniref:hypothetical protein n=1 Tax=Brachybacterium sp. NPDC056505 TaxID=3345843 RepID=UPI00366CDD08
MTNTSAPPEPTRLDPSTFPLEKKALNEGVEAALMALPAYFEFDNSMGGIDATDLHNLNTLLGAAIEGQVVEALNGLRTVWDPHREWTDYAFVRSSQAFPDVRLQRRTPTGTEVAIGIELKGWFLLAKEGEPSLRYKVAPAACEPWDLVCVVPWYLNNAVAGTAQVITPWVEQARYAAEWRDHWWEFVRKPKNPDEPRGVTSPASAVTYPSKADEVSASPDNHETGDNFGRLPRCHPLMDGFIDEALTHSILGIPAKDWMTFLKAHKDGDKADPEVVIKTILGMNKKTKAQKKSLLDADVENLLGLLQKISSYDFSLRS